MNTDQMSSMVFYLSYAKGLIDAGFSDADRLEFYDALIFYGTCGQLPHLTNPALIALFAVCKENIDASNRKKKRYEQCCENGRKGGAPKGNRNAAKNAKTKSDSQIKGEKPQENKNPKVPQKMAKNQVQKSKANKIANHHAQPSHPQHVPYDNHHASNRPKTTNKTTITDTATVTATATETYTKTSSFQKEKEKGFHQGKSHPLPDAAPAQSLNARNIRFFYSLQPYREMYGETDIQAFYEYWREPNHEMTRMRFEMERAWDLKRRVDAWMEKRRALGLCANPCAVVY